MKKNEFAKMWCELNRWRTPKKLYAVRGRRLLDAEIHGALIVLELLTTQAERIGEWQRMLAAEEKKQFQRRR